MGKLEQDSVIELYNRVKMPMVGFGGSDLSENHEKQTEIFREAIRAGYRYFDTAAIYHSERSIGEAVEESGIPREQFFISSKVWDADMRRGTAAILSSFEETLRRLHTDYLDIYYLHWPVTGRLVDSWKAIELLYYTGRVRALGVSNVKRHHIVEIMRNCDVMPHVQQDEFSPYCMRNDMRRFDDYYGIRYEAMMPLKRLKYEKEDGVLGRIAASCGKSIQQTVLRWCLQHGVPVLPKSVSPKRMRDNLDIFDFEISGGDMERIDALNFEGPINWDPDLFDF